MKDSFKTIIMVAALAGVVFLQHTLVAKNAPAADGSEANQKIIATLKIDFGGGEVRTFNDIELEEGATVFALLKKTAEKNNLELSFKEFPGTGVFIESIDGLPIGTENNKWWQYWVNEEYANVGASSFKLKNGDSIEWKYIEGQF